MVAVASAVGTTGESPAQAPAPTAAAPAAQAAPGQFTASSASAPTATRSQSRSRRLARAPEMFGDFLFTSEATLVDIGAVDTRAVFPLGGLGLKVGDNNSPLPRDRVFYRLNYFNNAITSEQEFGGGALLVRNAESLAQHTFGVEKTFFDKLLSIEVRAAFANRVDLADTTFFGTGNADFALSAGGEGNLFAIGKLLLHETESSAWSIGLGVEAPTGRNAFVLVGADSDPLRTLTTTIVNDSVHLHPFLARVSAPNRRWFSQMFLEVDVPVTDNTVVFAGLEDPPLTVDVAPPTLFNIDLSTGYWFYQGRRHAVITSLAGLVELHSSTTINDTEIESDLRVNGAGDSISGVAHGSFAGDEFGTLNFTAGVHMEFGDDTNLRVGGVFPLGEDKPFENELTVQLNQRF